MKSGEGWKARAFRGDAVVGEVFSEPSRDEAIAAVMAFLDRRADDRRSRASTDGFPCAEEVTEALAQIRLTKLQRAMLTAHLAAPDQIMTATELAHAGGHKNYAVANRWYGQLGRELAAELDWVPQEHNKGIPVWTFTLAGAADPTEASDEADDSAHWRWRLRPEVVTALTAGRALILNQ